MIKYIVIQCVAVVKAASGTTLVRKTTVKKLSTVAGLCDRLETPKDVLSIYLLQSVIHSSKKRDNFAWKM